MPRMDDTEKLLRKARKGDTSVLPALRAYLDSKPGVVERAGDLARHARDVFIEMLSGDDLLRVESVKRTLAALTSELAGPTPTPLETLLVDRIAVCWLHQQWAEAVYVQTLKAQGSGIRLLEYLEHRIDRCHRRFLSAVRALATVRKLLRPVVAQVNIAREQVNVAAGAPLDDQLAHAIGAPEGPVVDAPVRARECASDACTPMTHDGMIVPEEG
ncbi:MAG TPA: hypothetical protein PLD23_19820 [Armatimonadota bacterium]|nr:hypothetical protein [Armatimonadota bacterium]